MFFSPQFHRSHTLAILSRFVAISSFSFCLLLVLSGCGGGGGSSQVAVCSLDSFTPNYAHNVSHLFNWNHFPLQVAFLQDANYTQARQNIAMAGFDQWVTASGSAMTYQVVTDSSTADVTVKFDPATTDGLTNLHFSGLTMTHADVNLGIKNLGSSDLQCVAAHEFGHVLGIDGHSDLQNDLMYPIHFVGVVCPVTTRDLNTIKTAYCNTFGRSVATPTPSPKSPERVIQIH